VKILASKILGGLAPALPLLFGLTGETAFAQQSPVTVEEVRAIAKEAYIYGFPLVDNYRIQNAYFVDKDNPDYKAPWNQLVNIPRVFTPEDKAVQTPNSDTPYSWIGLDLRTEPMVFTVPPIEKERYFTVQLIDLYTYNFDYLGSRTTGNEGGSFLLAGPNWHGETPAGVKKVLRSETEGTVAASVEIGLRRSPAI
jgi:hypothetical protein